MNKSDLIKVLADRKDLPAIEATKIVKLVFEGFTDALKEGERIEIRGFGTFSVREYGGYTGRNPKTGKNVQVKPKRGAYFKVGKELKARVDG